MVYHAVYGLRIESNVPLPGLPVVPTVIETDVHIRLKEKSIVPSVFGLPAGDILYTSPKSDDHGENTLRVCMLAGARYFGFFYGDGARFAIGREGGEIWGDWPDNYSLEDACTYLMGPVIAFVLRLRGATCLHASAVSIGDGALALFGLAGSGKSTTAAAFAMRGFAVLSDDVSVLDDRGDSFLVQPGYPRLNLWPDSVRTLFGSEDALSLITPTWGKRYLQLDKDGRKFQAGPLPLKGIYILAEREGDLAGPVVEELAGCDAFTTLVANTYVNYLLDRDMRAREFDVLSRLLARVPVRRVRPTGDPSKIFELCETIAADAAQLAYANR